MPIRNAVLALLVASCTKPPAPHETVAIAPAPPPPIVAPDRPKNLRGRKFKPCKDGEVAPACKDGVCVAIGYRC